MTSKQESKLKMFMTVRIYLLSNPTITANLPNFPEFMASLDAAIQQIQVNSEQYQSNSKGVTVEKREIRETLMVSTADNARKMQAFGKYQKNTVLLAETKFTETFMKPLSEMELVNVANGLYGRINEYLPDVTKYGLTIASQADFMIDITAYSDAIPQSRQHQLGKKENIFLENIGFELGDTAIGNIDSVVEIVRNSEPTFYAGYKNARKIIEHGKGTLQVQGIVTDATSQQPIVDATLVFRLSGQPEISMQKQSAAKGGFKVKSLAEGIYEVTISKIGYQTQTITVTICFDQLCDVNAALIKM